MKSEEHHVEDHNRKEGQPASRNRSAVFLGGGKPSLKRTARGGEGEKSSRHRRSPFAEGEKRASPKETPSSCRGLWEKLKQKKKEKKARASPEVVQDSVAVKRKGSRGRQRASLMGDHHIERGCWRGKGDENTLARKGEPSAGKVQGAGTTAGGRKKSARWENALLDQERRSSSSERGKTVSARKVGGVSPTKGGTQFLKKKKRF